jgi:hypothetical protein
MASKEYNPADTDKQTGAISAIEIFQPLIIRAVNAEELIASHANPTDLRDSLPNL